MAYESGAHLNYQNGIMGELAFLDVDIVMYKRLTREKITTTSACKDPSSMVSSVLAHHGNLPVQHPTAPGLIRPAISPSESSAHVRMSRRES